MEFKLEMSKVGYEKVFGDVGKANEVLQEGFSVKLNAEVFHAQVKSYSRNDYVWGTSLELNCELLPLKSKEEIAAEEAVKKAEEALKAAKEVLNKVKDK